MQKKGKIPCPACGRLFIQAGLSRHISHCKKMSTIEKPTIERIRKLPRSF